MLSNRMQSDSDGFSSKEKTELFFGKSVQECGDNSRLLHFLGLLHPHHLQKARRWNTDVNIHEESSTTKLFQLKPTWSIYDDMIMIWCVYIYIYYNIYYITYHMMFQSFWPSNTGVVLVVTVMSIAVALIPLPAALLWVRASTKNTPLKGCFVKTSVFWLTNLFELFDVGVILIWWFD